MFHEVGAWDSIADIVTAAALIEAAGASRWTVGAIPLGSGRLRTAHGALPAPAPATALLLEGFLVIDDGVAGERVTPTGAAILRHLVREAPAVGVSRRLAGSGFGFGERRVPGLSNCVRFLRYDPVDAHAAADQVLVVEFEVDDQSAEDLALGLDMIRAKPSVYDVVQLPVFGKKGRLVSSIRILADPAALDEVASLCFEETATIGLRYRIENRRILSRGAGAVRVGEHKLRIKTAHRPGGPSVKVEADDLAETPRRQTRDRLRRSAEIGDKEE
jgi:uncharacterized protein (DUF111 family)